MVGKGEDSVPLGGLAMYDDDYSWEDDRICNTLWEVIYKGVLKFLRLISTILQKLRRTL